MKSKFVLTAMLACSMVATAFANVQRPSVAKDFTNAEADEQMFKHIQPTYLEGSFISEGWKSNWFLGVSGGVNAFVGSPLGCEDIFGRMMPALQVQFGKWFTPSVGSRIVYQGFRFKDSDIRTQGYGNFHMDMLWNPFAVFYKGADRPRFDAMPYVGVGFIHNNDLSTNPFAFSYGIHGRFRVTDRLHITAELGGTTTFKSFDGTGSTTAMGDNLLSLTAGVSWTIGNVGWKRVIDPKPYIDQNNRLMAYAYSLRDRNRDLSSRHNHDMRVIGELKKILKIEGLLKKHGPRIAKLEDMRNGDSNLATFPKNDYSGLNSLMARLRGYGFDNDALADLADGYGAEADMTGNLSDLAAVNSLSGMDGLSGQGANESSGQNLSDNDANGANPLATGSGSTTNGMGLSGMNGNGIDETGALPNSELWRQYWASISNGKECIGAPIYFFFRIGTTTLTDASQLVNLDEIARLAKKYNLKVKVTGAADSATGNDRINNSLGSSRADYIADQLKQRGIPFTYINLNSRGGISDHSPIEANRHTRVELWCR